MKARLLIVDDDAAIRASLANEGYHQALNVDLEDPCLGLAPEALGGEGGRREPTAPR